MTGAATDGAASRRHEHQARPPRCQDAGRRSLRGDPLAWALLGFALVLGSMAWPAFEHHGAALLGQPAITVIEAGGPLTEDGVQRALTSRQEALAAMDSAWARRELGQVHLRRALTPDLAPALRNVAAREAATAIRAALARSPADHFAWYHLAVAEALLGRTEKAAAALGNAYGFGPYHPPIGAARARLGVTLWDELAADSRDLVLSELAQTTLARR